MAKWETYFFKMNRGMEHEQTVAGVGYKGLALLKTSEKSVWSLTHMRSGLRVIKIEGALKDVRRVGVAIADLIDWDAYATAQDVVAAHPSIPQQIDAIASFAETDGATAGSA